MASYVTLTLDTTAPAGVTIVLAGGASTTTTRDISAAIATSDSPTTGYQMKVWGSVDPAFDAQVQATEGASAWISYATSKSIRLSTGDGLKTVNLKVRDDVGNESTQQSDTITLDTLAPVITVGAPSATKLSKVATFDTITFAWTSDIAIAEYKVKAVPLTTSDHTQGTLIPTAGGSLNVAETASIAGGAGRTTTIKGTDLESASAGDGSKIVKVFARTASGNWSV